MKGFEKGVATSLKKGIHGDAADVKKRTKVFGDNQPIVKDPKTIFELIMENFEDEMLRILCGAAAVSLVLGIATEGLREGWLEGASILVAVVIIVSVTSINNYIKEKQFRKLNEMATQKNVNVIRHGNQNRISVYDLQVGDLVEIETGEILSVDGVLVEGSNVTADESAITGESKLIEKTVPEAYDNPDISPFLISGSKVMEGTGRMVVLAVGRNSYYGKIKLKIQQDQDDTPLQEKLSTLAEEIGNVGLVSAICTFSAMFLHYIYDCAMGEDFMGQLISWDTLHELIEYFIIAVSIVVVAVPEGLPLAVTIALAYSVGKMKDENNLVRYLQACETMGGANNICSDKTGTLTKNLMTVTKIFVEQTATGNIDDSVMKSNTSRLLSIGICVNSTARPKVHNKSGKTEFEQIGNKTECALLEMAFKFGYDFQTYRDREKEKILKLFPFSSEKKKMTVVYQDGKSVLSFTKGAPDFLIGKCTKFVNKDGQVAKINNDFLRELKDTISNFASESLRTILLTYREFDKYPGYTSVDDYENDLTIIAMVGIKDPLRDEIPLAVEICKSAGVTVRMVTGDNKETAIAIAKEAGILEKDWDPETDPYAKWTVMEGKEFRNEVGGLINEGTEDETVGDEEAFKSVDKYLRVLARSSPDDKYLMATGLKKLGHVVAMTGDGTNDAPALKKADIGFAMGIAGTEVAKEASGIILLDDNFKSIVTAMKWGRNIFDCIRKFLQFQLTVNFVALVMAFVGGAMLRESPLNAIQMLWVNLIMDTLASLALATEPPSDELLQRKPYSRNESLITANMWKNIISQGLVQIAILGTILFKGPEILDVPSSIGVKDWNEETGKHYSIFFNVFVLLQIFNEINARKLKHEEINVFKNFFNNPLFVGILVLTFIVQLSIIKLGGKSLKTVELTLEENIICLLLGSLSLFAGFVEKTILPAHLIVCPYGIEINTWKFYWRAVPVEPEEGAEGA